MKVWEMIGSWLIYVVKFILSKIIWLVITFLILLALYYFF